MDTGMLSDLQTAKAIEYLLALSFLALFVPFWRYTAPRVAVLVEAVDKAVEKAAVPVFSRALRPEPAGWFHVPDGLGLHPGHAWAKAAGGGEVLVGADGFARAVIGCIDDVARRIVTGVSSFTLPPVGTRLRRGDPIVALRCGQRIVAIPSPVDGLVLERNRSLMQEPSLFEREPYGEGWLLRIETESYGPIEGVSGSASKTWLREENLRLNHFLEARLGMAAADGGTLTAPPALLLPEDAWREATRSFLRAA